MKKIVLFIALLSFISNYSVSQPKFIVHLTGGYGVPLGDFKTEVPTTERADADWFPYYTKKLINFGADGKLAIGKKGNFRAVIGLAYNMFSNDVDAILRADTATGRTTTTGFRPKVNITSVSLGGEWAFMPKGKVNPFIGARIAGNFFGGKFEFDTVVYVKGVQRTGPMDMKSETRIGFIFDGGIDFMLSKNIGAVIGINYHMINPLGKGTDDPSEIGPNEIDLGDQEHTEDNMTFPARTISSFSGYAGISFYFGAPKTVRK